MTGQVKWSDAVRGYGFIEDTDAHTDYFFHFSAIQAEKGEQKKLEADDKVEFDLEKDEEKGKLKAVNVRKL